MQLLLSLVRVQDVILLGMAGDAARGSWPLRPEIRLLHVDSMACGQTRFLRQYLMRRGLIH